MKLTCDMTLDLIALYFDKAASEDSVRAVNEHLLECPSCAAAYSAYKRSLEQAKKHPHQVESSEIPVGSYAELARSLRNRHRKKVAGVVALITLSMFIGSWVTTLMLPANKSDE